MTGLPPNHPFAASITPATKIWSAPPPTPLVDWDVVSRTPRPATPSTPTPRKRPLAMLLKPKKDSPVLSPKTPKAPKTPKFAKSPPSTPRPSLDSVSSMASPRTPKRTTTRGSFDSPASPASSAGPLTPPSFLRMRRLPSLPNLRRKKSPEFDSETRFNSFECSEPPLGFEWANHAAPLLPIYHEHEVSRSDHGRDVPEPYEKESTASPECTPDTVPDTASTRSETSDKRARRQGQIFTPGFADALRAEIEACRCSTPCGDAQVFDDAHEEAREMVAQLRAFGIL